MTAFQYDNLWNVLPKSLVFIESFYTQNVFGIPATTFKHNFPANARDHKFCANARNFYTPLLSLSKKKVL